MLGWNSDDSVWSAMAQMLLSMPGVAVDAPHDQMESTDHEPTATYRPAVLIDKPTSTQQRLRLGYENMSIDDPSASPDVDTSVGLLRKPVTWIVMAIIFALVVALISFLVLKRDGRQPVSEQVANSLNNLTSETIKPAQVPDAPEDVPDAIAYDSNGEAIRVFVYDTANLTAEQLVAGGVTPQLLDIAIATEIAELRYWDEIQSNPVVIQARQSNDAQYVQLQKELAAFPAKLEYQALLLQKLKDANVSPGTKSSVSSAPPYDAITKSELTGPISVDILDITTPPACVVITDLPPDVEDPQTMQQVWDNFGRITSIALLRYADKYQLSCGQAE